MLTIICPDIFYWNIVDHYWEMLTIICPDIFYWNIVIEKCWPLSVQKFSVEIQLLRNVDHYLSRHYLLKYSWREMLTIICPDIFYWNIVIEKCWPLSVQTFSIEIQLLRNVDHYLSRHFLLKYSWREMLTIICPDIFYWNIVSWEMLTIICPDIFYWNTVGLRNVDHYLSRHFLLKYSYWEMLTIICPDITYWNIVGEKCWPLSVQTFSIEI